MFHSMKRAFFILLCLVLAPFGPAQAQPAHPAAQAAPRILVELYTAQGCYSCPNANRLLGELTREPDVFALTFPVGYWDYLGWTDTMARPEFSDRQRDYKRALGFRGLATPQFIFNGASQIRGASAAPVRAMLQTMRQAETLAGPHINITRVENTRATIEIGAGRSPAAPADIWLAIYDPGPRMVRILGGENDGRVVVHYNVVQRVRRLGLWNGEAAHFERQSCRPRCALLVQGPNGGAILAFAALR
jgi:hypothetical protein